MKNLKLIINSGGKWSNPDLAATNPNPHDNGTNKATLIGPASTADVTLTLPSTTDTLAAQGDVTALAIALG